MNALRVGLDASAFEDGAHLADQHEQRAGPDVERREQLYGDATATLPANGLRKRPLLFAIGSAMPAIASGNGFATMAK